MRPTDGVAAPRRNVDDSVRGPHDRSHHRGRIVNADRVWVLALATACCPWVWCPIVNTEETA